MTIEAWRFVKRKYSANVLKCTGTENRWNLNRELVLYFASSPSTALLEIFIHLRNEKLLSQYVLFRSTLAPSWIEYLDPTVLPANWRVNRSACQQISTRWISTNNSLVLAVPATTMPLDTTYLINPLHKDFNKFSKRLTGPYDYAADERLKELLKLAFS